MVYISCIREGRVYTGTMLKLNTKYHLTYIDYEITEIDNNYYLNLYDKTGQLKCQSRLTKSDIYKVQPSINLLTERILNESNFKG